jgi:hypothetical protein
MVCTKEERCSIEDDMFPVYIKMKEADGIILASPVYYGSATALIKALRVEFVNLNLVGRTGIEPVTN